MATIDGKAIKIASMVDEPTRESVLDIVERSITGDRLVKELTKVFAATGGPPRVLRLDNGPEMISQALQQFCDGLLGISYIPPGTPWNNWYIESFNNRLRRECLNRNHWNSLLEARVVIGDFKHEHNTRHRFLGLAELLCDVALIGDTGRFCNRSPGLWCSWLVVVKLPAARGDRGAGISGEVAVGGAVLDGAR